MNWAYIMIHHSLTKDGQVVDWNAIRRYHIKTRGWRDIGYNYGVEKVNGVYQVMLGRDLNIPGAHCKHSNMNRLAIGICVVGNYDNRVPSIKSLNLLAAAVVVPLMRKYDIPIENIVRHHDYTPYKTCPGKMFPMLVLKELCRKML